MRLYENQNQSQERNIVYPRQWNPPQKNHTLEWLYQKISNKDVHILGSGASLYGIDWSKFDDKETFVINNTIRYYPNPTAHLFIDSPAYLDGPLPDGVPVITSILNAVREPYYGVHLTSQYNPDFSAGYYSPFSTAHLAISVAMAHGAKRVLLWGVEQMFFTDEEAEEFSEYTKTNPYYIKHDIAEVRKRISERGQNMGHFYSEEITHRKDKLESPYKNAGNKMDVFKNDNIYNMSPVHNTPFKFLHWSQI